MWQRAVAKEKTVYICQGCGAAEPKWMGQCPECGKWNSLVEERAAMGGAKAMVRLTAGVGPLSIAEISGDCIDRLKTGVGEFDRVLGGGLVAGSAVLIGGDPGIGKSTLLLQVMGSVAAAGHRVLYVSGEESSRQIKLRGERLGVVSERLMVWSETNVDAIIDTLKAERPEVAVVDSVQTLFTDALDSPPGSVGQVKEVSARLVSASKALEVPVLIVGHVTKDGAIAGPKMLEHMVDTVLYFEGDGSHMYRVLRAAKNRFGSVMEIGVFEMSSGGLVEITNPSEVFLAERPEGASGSAVVPCMEGTRTVLVEVQSLVCPSVLGVPRRTVVGVDYNKVVLLAAILEKKAGMSFSSHDIFIKVAGGIRIDEPAVDLALLASMASNHMDTAVGADTVVFGEVGLAGEVRAVAHVEPRLREAEKLGFKRCVMPRDNLKGLGNWPAFELVGVSMVSEALNELFG